MGVLVLLEMFGIIVVFIFFLRIWMVIELIEENDEWGFLMKVV